MESKYTPVKLGELLKYRKEFIKIDDASTYKRVTAKLRAQGIFLRDEVEGFEIKTKKQQLCKPGDFLVAEIDAKVGGFGIVPEELEGAIVSSHYFLFEIDESRLNRQFLNYYLKTDSFQNQINAQGSTNYAAIRPADILEIEIFLPSLNEQKRIVTIIDRTMERVNEAKLMRISSLKDAESLLLSFKNTIFSEKTTKWSLMKLGDIADIKAGVTLGRKILGSTVTMPYLRVANVQDGHLNLNHIKQIEILASEANKWLLKSGDILLTEGGDWDKLGRGTVWQGEIENCIHQNHIFRVRVDPEEFDPYFLSMLIGSSYGKRYFQKASKQTTNLASINQKQLKAFKVFKPPLHIQRQIVDRLTALQSKVDEIKLLQKKTQHDIGELVPSVLNKAFAGEL